MALLPSDPAQQKRLLMGLLPIVIAFGYWYRFYGADKEEIAAMRTHLEELETKNQVALTQSRRGGPELEQRVALYEQYMVRLEQLIPEREEVPRLLHSMTEQAQVNGVELVLMRPQEEVQEQYYNRQTYQLGVAGPYHNVGAYISSIGSLPRIVSPVGLQIRPIPNAPGRDGAPRVEASFRIQTFVLPPKPAADSAVGGTHATG